MAGAGFAAAPLTSKLTKLTKLRGRLMKKEQDLVSRRTFVKGTAAVTAASAFTIVEAKSVRGTTANSMVEIGWVGNGGQGTRDAQLLELTGEAKIVAVGDYFKTQADKAATRFKVDAKRIHVG